MPRPLGRGNLLIIVKPHIKVKSESDVEKAKEAIEKSEQHCLISSSIKSKVTVLLKIEGNF